LEAFEKAGRFSFDGGRFFLPSDVLAQLFQFPLETFEKAGRFSFDGGRFFLPVSHRQDGMPLEVVFPNDG
jgi:hypothetical protein